MSTRESAYNLLGSRFYKLVVIEVLPVYISKGGKRTRKLRCRCDCGGEILTRLDTLKSGQSKSCGCISKQRLEEGRRKHGYHLHPLYKTWTGIKQRCYNPKNAEYHNYGAKGVRICEEWRHDAAVFINWALENGWESGLEIDKDIIPMGLGIDALLYSPQTCCFVTPKVNSNNRSITVFIKHNGERLCISDWAQRTGISRKRIYDRHKKGWPPERILDPTNYADTTKYKKKTA